MRTVAGKHEGQLAVAHCRSRDHRGFGAGDEITERGDRIRLAFGRHDESLWVMVAAAGGRAQQRRRPLGRRAGERVLPALRQRAQRLLGARRDDQRGQRTVVGSGLRLLPRRRGQHRVTVGAAETE